MGSHPRPHPHDCTLGAVPCRHGPHLVHTHPPTVDMLSLHALRIELGAVLVAPPPPTPPGTPVVSDSATLLQNAPTTPLPQTAVTALWMEYWAPHVLQAPAAYRSSDLLLAQSTREFTLGGEPTIDAFRVNYPIGGVGTGTAYHSPIPSPLLPCSLVLRTRA